MLTKCAGFEWDKGNLLKNWEEHGVTGSESNRYFSTTHGLLLLT